MAGNKMNTKTKGKEDKNKANTKAIGQTSEETEETDFSLLRKPILTSITGFGQARKIFDLATEELKDLLSNECDLLYECKVCRNIFRSLANFISHKRVYCKEKFNSSLHSHFIKATSTVTEIMKIKHMEQGYQESLKETIETENKEDDDVDDRVPLTKDLTEIVEKIAKHKGVYENNTDEPHIALQKIPNSSVAMFQNVQMCEDKQKENMRVQVNELDTILSRDIAVLQSDGNFKIKSSVAEDSDSVIQISDDDDNDHTNVLKCKICDMQFSTQKTLKFHMKYKHVETRLVYPCPDCLEIFSTSWSVYRHLFKVHRKTAAQIRRLRESIQAKAFKIINPPAFYEKRKNNMKSAITAPQKITEEERLDQENQAWMDNMEGDGELPRCGGCGRTFERRAALAAHTHTCQPRSRALARRPLKTKKIEIQIRKDYNKGPPVNLNLPPKTTEVIENKISKDEQQIVPKANKDEEKSPVEEEKEVEDTVMDVSEDEQKSNDASESPEPDPEPEPEPTPRVEISELAIRLPFAHQAEKSNHLAFRQRLQSEIDLDKMLCKICEGQFSEVQSLFDHVANHIKWYRYACKLCNFKNYYFDKLPEHVKIVHKLKGDKDFYFSTVKAINGTEALELCEPKIVEESPDANETSPDSRRPSRCSSDSSRLSDDSSSSSTRIEGISRKRKLYQSKNSSKRRKEFVMKVSQNKDHDSPLDKGISLIENDVSSNNKSFEENSSDIDDIDEKITKKQIMDDTSSVASRRPVRRKTKPKNEDFEYDLSNLLKRDAQGYRDCVTTSNAKSTQAKRKLQQEIQINYDNLNKDCCGALFTMSKKSVEKSGAHMKTSFLNVPTTKDVRTQNIFVRPMLPKILTRVDKVSPKKDNNEDPKECSSPSKEIISNEVSIEDPQKRKDDVVSKESSVKSPQKPIDEEKPAGEVNQSTVSIKTCVPTTTCEIVKTKNIPSVLPLKFRRQSLEVIKNPLINKNITDFTKSGMKTKILVIKPINRNKDGKQPLNTPLKFQTIKLKDPNKSSCNEEKDQVVVVKVPKVDCTIARPTSEITNKNNEKLAIVEKSTPNDNDISKLVKNDETNSTVTIPDNAEVNKPTEVEDDNTNINNNIIEDESCNIDSASKDETVEFIKEKDTTEHTDSTL